MTVTHERSAHVRAVETAVAAEHVELVGHPNLEVRCALAMNPHLSDELQTVLLQDPEVLVRRSLAARSRVLPDVFQALARDSSAMIRGRVATREDLPAHVVQVLARDSDARVRLALSINPSVVFSTDMPVAFLDITEEGQDLVKSYLEAAGIDLEVASALRGSWSGTLEELVETAKEFGASSWQGCDPGAPVPALSTLEEDTDHRKQAP